MNKKMRALALVLVGIMSIGVLGGCGQKAEVETAAPATTEGQVEVPVKEGSEEPVHLTWWTIGSEPNDLQLVNDKINEYTLEKLNVTLDIRFASWGDYGDKLSKIVQSGEEYDIAFGAGIEGYANLANEGYFADLTDVIPSVAPDLNAFIPEDLWKGITVNEQIIGVPTFKDSAQSQYWVWDKELVEKLGIDYENINTLEDLEPALKKIKEDDPSTYPLILQGKEGINGFIAANNGYDEILTSPYVGIKYDDASATVVSPWDDEETMSNLRLLHKWFNEELINPDAATLTESPKYRPVFAAQGYPHADADWTGSSGYPVISHMFFGPAYSTKTIQGSFAVVSAGSKHIEEAVQVLELFNTDAYARNLLAFGIEDVHYKKTGDNTIEFINKEYEVPAYSQATFFNMYVVDPAPATKWTDLQAHNEKAFSSPALGFTMNTEPVQNEVAACANVADKYVSLLLTGAVDPDETVAKLIAELDSSGYRDIILEAQTQLDEYLGK